MLTSFNLKQGYLCLLSTWSAVRDFIAQVSFNCARTSSFHSQIFASRHFFDVFVLMYTFLCVLLLSTQCLVLCRHKVQFYSCNHFCNSHITPCELLDVVFPDHVLFSTYSVIVPRFNIIDIQQVFCLCFKSGFGQV